MMGRDRSEHPARGRRLLRAVQSGLLAASVVMIFAVVAQAAQAASWRVQSTPNPTGPTYQILQNGVSCSSASACTAVGSYWFEGAENYATLAERWNGKSWKIQSTPNPTGVDSGLNGVSCSSASACTAVGGASGTLAEAWNGSSWTIQSTPRPSSAQLLGVSCSSASACTAVGYFYPNSSGTFVTLAERWNGKSWKIQSTPNPTGARYTRLNGVSCSSARACTAVGYYYHGYNALTLVEGWNGKSWKIKSTRNPSGSPQAQLEGVSCSAASACTAVGWYRISPSDFALAERWNGKSWKIQSTPKKTVAEPLNGVSCSSARACTAVGHYYSARKNNFLTLAEAWNGKSWKIQSTPNPTGGQDNYLNGVSCSAASACTAVGNYYNRAGIQRTLTERYS